MVSNTSYQSSALFRASCVAMTVTSMTASIRAGLLDEFSSEFNLTGAEIGWAIGTAFWGFTLAMVFAGTLCDILGMKRLAYMGFWSHLAGIALTIFASGFWSLFLGTLLIGIANGMVEGYVNPLVAAMYPDQKIKVINKVHLWFPVGLVIGGLITFYMDELMMPFGIKTWQVKMAVILIPLVMYGYLFFRLKFPLTERVAEGISAKEMVKACLNPLFIIILILMTFTSMTEWGPNQWIEQLLQSVASPILVLAWIGTIMAIGRALAGRVLQVISSIELLLLASFFSLIGLVMLGQSSTTITVFASATIFALGITYFWPTMLGFVNENIPKSGALGLAVIGGWGMLASNFAQPLLGSILDKQIMDRLPKEYSLETVSKAVEGTLEWSIYQEAQLAAGQATISFVAVFPLILLFGFGLLY